MKWLTAEVEYQLLGHLPEAPITDAVGIPAVILSNTGSRQCWAQHKSNVTLPIEFVLVPNLRCSDFAPALLEPGIK